MREMIKGRFKSSISIKVTCPKLKLQKAMIPIGIGCQVRMRAKPMPEMDTNQLYRYS